MQPDAARLITPILESLQVAWNAADGGRFAEAFADDADFIDIRGDRHTGKQVIATGHAGIFASIYRGSTIKYEIAAARYLTEHVMLAHVSSTLMVPEGPFAGQQTALGSIVFMRSGARWKIAALHNMLVAQPAAPRAEANP